MFIFNKNELDSLLREFSSGFGSNPVKILVFVLVVIGFIAILIAMHLVYRRRDKALKTELRDYTLNGQGKGKSSVQRRLFYRQKLQLHVAVQSEEAESAGASSVTMDLSGGGASLGNPQSRYAVGDKIWIVLPPDTGVFSPLNGTVVRTSKNEEVLHIRFEPEKEVLRDRIVGLLHKKGHSHED